MTAAIDAARSSALHVIAAVCEKLRLAGDVDAALDLAKQSQAWHRRAYREDAARAATAPAAATPVSALRVVFTLSLPIQTFSEANIHEHHMQKHKRSGGQRELVSLCMRRFSIARGVRLALPATVQLWRLAPNELDVGDNLDVSLKHVRDGVADFFGVNDRDPRILFLPCKQVKQKNAGVLIEILRGEPPNEAVAC